MTYKKLWSKCATFLFSAALPPPSYSFKLCRWHSQKSGGGKIGPIVSPLHQKTINMTITTLSGPIWIFLFTQKQGNCGMQDFFLTGVGTLTNQNWRQQILLLLPPPPWICLRLSLCLFLRLWLVQIIYPRCLNLDSFHRKRLLMNLSGINHWIIISSSMIRSLCLNM